MHRLPHGAYKHRSPTSGVAAVRLTLCRKRLGRISDLFGAVIIRKIQFHTRSSMISHLRIVYHIIAQLATYLILRYAKFAFLKDKSNGGGNLSPPSLRPSNKYYLAVDDFGRPILYIVHPTDPHHLVSSFQLFCYALCHSQLLYQRSNISSACRSISALKSCHLNTP